MYTKWVLSIYIIKCLYVYCNFVEIIIRGEGGNLGGNFPPLKALKKHWSKIRIVHLLLSSTSLAL